MYANRSVLCSGCCRKKSPLENTTCQNTFISTLGFASMEKPDLIEADLVGNRFEVHHQRRPHSFSHLAQWLRLDGLDDLVDLVLVERSDLLFELCAFLLRHRHARTDDEHTQ